MMTYILFVVGVFGLSSVVTYLWWINFRVWCLKQDLFEVRDRLWDVARAKGFLDADSYRDARRSINALIRLSPRLSLPTLLFTIRKASEAEADEPSASEIPEVRAAIRRSAEIVVWYVFNRTLSGLIYRCLLGSAEDEQCETREASRMIMSPKLTAIDRGYQQAVLSPSLAV